MTTYSPCILYSAHMLVGEPVPIPDQVRDRLSPGHALTIRARNPEHVARALVVEIAAGHEQKIRQPIDVAHHLGRDTLARILQFDDNPLGTPADGAREMQVRGGG